MKSNHWGLRIYDAEYWNDSPCHSQATGFPVCTARVFGGLWIKLLHYKTAGGNGGGVISWDNSETPIWEGLWCSFDLNLETKVHLSPYSVQMAYSAQEHILHPYFPCCTMEYDAMHSACHSLDPVLHFSNVLHAGECWHISQAAVCSQDQTCSCI